jgi:uncharacterized protein YciI
MSLFVYKLLPPRPTFAQDMTPDERAIMTDHVTYWLGLLEQGRVVVFGPVQEPDRTWGLGVFEAEDLDEARATIDADPAISSGMATMELSPMVAAHTRG